jgi:hypothetical protein
MVWNIISVVYYLQLPQSGLVHMAKIAIAIFWGCQNGLFVTVAMIGVVCVEFRNFTSIFLCHAHSHFCCHKLDLQVIKRN